jgi:thermitase
VGIEYDPYVFDAVGVSARYGIALSGTILELTQAWFVAPVGSDVPALLDALEREPGVLAAERNGKFIAPECRQWNIDAIPLGPGGGQLFDAQPAFAALRMSGARSTHGSGVTVAVLDTGIALASPRIPAARRLPGIDLLTPGGLAEDGRNFLDDDGDQLVDEGWGHGTAVASLVHAVAPGASLLPVRVLDDDCRGTAFSFAAGIVRAVNAGARVLNLSFGTHDSSSVVEKAIRYARDRGAVIVAPVGNDQEREAQFPAKHSDTLGVAAVDSGLVAPAWTNHSSDVDLVAPGVDVIAPYRSEFARLSGTSFSAAFVSGAAAVAMQALPGLDGRDVGREIEDRFARSVEPWNPDLGSDLGSGIPDVGALERLIPGPRLRNPRVVMGDRVLRPADGSTGVTRAPGRNGPTTGGADAP